MEDLETPSYTIGQAAGAAGVSANTIRAWLQRGQLHLTENDALAEINGQPHHLSFLSSLMIAIMKNLIDCGISPKLAGKAARRFAHGGSGFTATGESVERLPGRLFDDGETWLIIAHHVPEERFMRVVQIKGDEPASRILSSRHAGHSGQVTIVRMDDIVIGVEQRLTVQPRRRSKVVTPDHEVVS